MSDQYLDFEELRPTDEASHIPDSRVEGRGGGDPHRQHVATNRAGSPDVPTESENECRSCSVSLPAGQTKCRFCLTTHLDDTATATTETGQESRLGGIVFTLVESSTFYGAVVKGGAAATLLTANETEPAVNDYRLISDLDETPARQLAEQWPLLPEAVQVSSGEGERLLSAARDRTGWN